MYAAAGVVNMVPRRSETQLILDLDRHTPGAIADAADHPNCETGRVLVRALNSESNELRQDYEARYGKLAATDRPA